MISTAKPKKSSNQASKVSRLRKPDELSLEAWQIELRRQFGREQKFTIKNIGEEPVFSEFEVTNPQSKNTYRVAIRGPQLGNNHCTCPDFTTNTLGTCKHIEFALAQIEKKPSGKAALGGWFQPSYSEVFLHYGAQREVRFQPGMECPDSIKQLARKHFAENGVLKPGSAGTFDQFLMKAGEFDHELRCQEDVLSFLAEVRDGDHRQQRLAELFPKGIRSKIFKDLLHIQLYDYQRHGALFAARAGRCLIGDDMGLGKTIQAIAAAEIMARYFGVERVLIVCPTSLKHQWQREIARFVNRSCLVLNGLRPRRQQLFTADSFYKITNYDTVYRDLDLINNWSPDLVILDEAQRIKNWSTRTAISVKRISSTYAFVLTGTPLENRLEELVSIVQFIDQFRLGPTFKLLHDHQVRDEHGKVVGYQQLDKIGTSLAPILIRRQRDEVLKELPERMDKNFFVPMTPQQRNLHEENREIVARIVHKWRSYRFLSEADQRRLMIALQNMRMSCDSTYLLDQTTDHGVKADELATLMEETFERSGTKVVVFSQWLRMHELLVRRFQPRQWDYVLFHGGVPGPKRKTLVDRFREDPVCRTFFATDAGGVGLNLQHASVVINMDIPWNPAVLEQRIGRVHRLGQKEPVRVVNFVAQGTIEEGMLSLLKFKKSLFAGVLDGGAKEVFLGGTRLNRFMETVEKATTSIPAESVEEPAEPTSTNGKKRAAKTKSEPDVSVPTIPISNDPWTGLLETGMALLQQLATASQPGKAHGQKADASSFVARDEKTGESFLKLPMPTPDVLDKALQSFQVLLESMRK